MFPPARIGDPITHDMLVPCGVILPAPGAPPTTIIEGMPAAHVGCLVACTGVITAGIVHPPPPGPPLPIITGCATVFVNGLPMARWAPAPDVAACGVFMGLPSLLPTRKVFVGP